MKLIVVACFWAYVTMGIHIGIRVYFIERRSMKSGVELSLLVAMIAGAAWPFCLHEGYKRHGR